MTTYLTFRAMREGKLKPDSLLTVSETAVAQAPSKMGFVAGTKLTVDNALKMLMVKSANDVAVVLAEGVSGSLPAFIREMNRVADEIGMTGTHFVNPNGLPEDGQVTTARDMAMLARTIMLEYPEHEMLFRIPAIRMGKRFMRNHNKLIDHYPGADGMKTGFICSSGFNVVASAKRGDKRLIVVVFGAYSSGQRTEDAARLLERGFQPRFSLATLFLDNRPTVDMIANVSGMPADLRELMCNRKRKRPAAESDIDEDDEEIVENDPGSARAKAPRVKEKGSLLVDLPPSMPPIQVYVGSSPPPPQKATAIRKTKTAGKPDDGKKKRKTGKKKQ